MAKLWYNISTNESEENRMNPFRHLMCVGALVLGLTGCSVATKKPVATESPNESITYEKGADFTGVVKSVDLEQKRIRFYNVLLEGDEEYEYSGGTEIFSKNDRDMSISEVQPGEVYDIYQSEQEPKVVKMKQTEDITEQKEVRVSINQDEKRLTVADVTYAYTDHLVVLSEGKEIQPMEITPSDEVTFRGVKGRAYSIVVTKGHGYIEPTKYSDFLGGQLTVQGEAILPIGENMLLTVPEGTQTISMVNGDLTGEASVLVKRGQVTKVNMKQYQSQMPDTGRVKFEIEPEGAELYINGTLTDYSKRVSLKYGSHSIRVVLEGYNEYSGVITVKDAGPTCVINLAEEKAEVSSEDDSSANSSVSDNDSSNSDKTDTSTVKTDSNHKITVSTPTGAAVYLNGTYKGVAPCSFTKALGSVTVTLTKEGYTTKSYTIEISDDSKDVNWSFPDLEKAGSSG